MSVKSAQTSPFTIPANGSIHIDATGEFVRCLTASADFYMSVDGNAEMIFFEGAEYTCQQPEAYRQITLVNKTGLPINVQMVWGYGSFKDGRLSVAGTLKTKEVVGNNLDVNADVSAPSGIKTTLVAGDADRKKVIISSLSTNTAPARIGNAGYASANRGIEILPGGYVSLETTAAICVWHNAGVDQTFAVLEVKE